MTSVPGPPTSTLATRHGADAQPLDLGQRMALRRSLAERAVQVGLALLGVERASYRARAVPIDARHHRFVVTLDVDAGFCPRQSGRPLRRRAVEAFLQDLARGRYRVTFDAVYWRGASPALGLDDESGEGGSVLRDPRSAAGTGPAAWDVQVSEEERQALLDAVQGGLALPPLLIDDETYRTGPAPLEDRPDKGR